MQPMQPPNSLAGAMQPIPGGVTTGQAKAPKAINARTLVSALAGEQPGMARAWIRQTTRFWLLFGIGVVLLLIAGVLVWQAGTYGWQTGDWERFSGALLTLLTPLFLIGGSLLLFSLRVWQPGAVAAPIRDLLARNDDALAPVVTVPPAPGLPIMPGIPIMPAMPANGELRLTRLRRLYIVPRWWRSEVVLWSQIFMACVVIVTNIPHVFGIDNPGFGDLTLFFGCMLLSAQISVLIAPSVAIATYAQSYHRRLLITADDIGLSWQLAGRRQHDRYHAPWSEVRSFAFVDYESATSVYESNVARAFLVDAGMHQLAWVMTSRSQPDEYFEAALLTHTILTRTGKSLRDLNYARAQLERTERKPQSGQPSWPRTIIPAETLATLAALQRHAARQLLWLIPGVLIFALLFAGTFFFPGQMAARQQDYFAGLAPQIARAHVLYHDTLTTPDGGWPVGPNQRFANGAYQLTAPTGQNTNFISALLPQSYQNLAVAVTIQGGLGSAGLVLRADGPLDAAHPQNAALVFAINPGSDSWDLEEYDSQGLAFLGWQQFNQISAAIHTGTNDSNRLLALMRGGVLLLYVNDQLVDFFPGASVPFGSFSRYSPEYEPQLLIDPGQVGIFAADNGTATSFTDFTVYTVTAPPTLNYV